MSLSKSERIVDPRFRGQLLDRDGRCLACGSVLDENTINPHHIETRGSGGDDLLENGISLCARCHVDGHNGHTTIEGEQVFLTPAVFRWLLVLNYGYEYEQHLLGDDVDQQVAEHLYYRYTFRPTSRF